MNYRVHIQYPKHKDMGLCGVSLDKHGQALLLTADGKGCVKDMTRARVDWIGGHGMMLSGMEENGHDKNLRIKYSYQEWYCAYVEEKK